MHNTRSRSHESTQSMSASRWLLQKLRPYAKQVALGLAIASCAGGIATIDPLLMQHLIDVALPAKSLRQSGLTVLFIALCFVGRSALGGLSGVVSFLVSQKLAQDLRTELLAHMTSLSADWHEKTKLGEKVSRIDQDVEQISQYGSDVGNTVFRVVIFFLVNLAIMMALNWRMTVLVLPLLPLFLWVRIRFRQKIQSTADRAQAEVGNASGNLTEHLGAVPQIQILNAEDARVARTVQAWLDLLGAQWVQRKTEVAFSISVTSVLAVGILLVLGMGAHEYFAGALTIGGLVAFYAYVTRIFEPLSSAMELYSRTQRMMASTRRVREVLGTEPSVLDTGTIRDVPGPLRAGLECQAVSFAYTPDLVILSGVTLRIQPHERVALVGKSGSGKSTLSRLFARMADPSSGPILLDGEPLRNYTLRALRQAVCYVPQQPVLFSATIRENLLYANPVATADQLQNVVDAAQLETMLGRLPLGLDTMLGQDGAGISGGERQRLAIARALLREPSVLILDESTSALDLPTEDWLFRAISTFRREMSMILISHRLRSLCWVDRIIVLDSGESVADGTHTELYRLCPLYRTLYDLESEGADVRSGVDQPTDSVAPLRV
jgi:ABC-type multidrug transport system fused ATPase/permease subunit